MAVLNERGIIEAIKTTLATINGAGAYTYDLSATGRVAISGSDQLGTPPYAAFIPTSIVSTQEGGTFCQYVNTMIVEIAAVVPFDGLATELAILAALNIGKDIRIALTTFQNQLFLGAENIRTLSVSIETYDGADAGYEGTGVAMCTAEIVFTTEDAT